MGDTTTNTPRAANTVVERESARDMDALFGVSGAGGGIVPIPRRLVEALNWAAGTRVHVQIVDVDAARDGERGLLVTRAR